jgi:SAM-dependent methyltransferase
MMKEHARSPQEEPEHKHMPGAHVVFAEPKHSYPDFAERVGEEDMESRKPGQPYVLGHDPLELARLDRQAAIIERPTRMLLQAAGMAAGWRVLDVGTGLGHVARIAGEIVGPTGAVIGIDPSVEALAVARERSQAAGVRHVSFEEGDVSTWSTGQPFDAIVGRLLLFHLGDPVAAVRQLTRNLRNGGQFIAVDFDLGGARSEPRVGLAADVLGWIEQAFAVAGASPRIGARLGMILREAGLEQVATFGVQAYLSPQDRASAALIASVARTLAPVIVERGIATAEQLGIDTLEDRLAAEFQRADAVMLPPTVVGAWGAVTGR